MAKIQQAVGRDAPYVDVLPPPIIAQRAPATTDTNYPKGQGWIDESVSPAILYYHIGGGDWNSNELTLSTDDTFAAASDSTASSSLAIKTYVDGVAIAGAPVATEVTAGIGELATDAEAVAGTSSTALVAYLLTPSNLAAVFAAPPAQGGTTPAAGTFTDLTTGRCVFTPDSITSDNAGVAASVSTLLTLITTDGDSNEDNVTLADGQTGQVKMFAVVAAGNAADSVKITPANMAGGTQITFAADPTGLGCTMCFDGTNWTVVSNNGGTIA